MTNAQTQLQAAYNEFIADFVDRHERVPSTRDEAHDVADKIVAMAKEVAALCKKYAATPGIASDAANDLVAEFFTSRPGSDDFESSSALASAAIAVALESAA